MHKINNIIRNPKLVIRFASAVVPIFFALILLGITSSQVSAAPPKCPSGQIYRNSVGKCVKNTFGCLPGQTYDEIDGCVGGSGSNAPTVTCSDGVTKVLKGQEGTCPVTGGKVCGSKDSGTQTTTSINLGCKGKGNAITDLTFAIIRFLSNGVGIIVVGSLVWAGIQYTSSRGDPKATTEAINRIRANVFALLLYVFAYAMLNYVIPGGFLK